LKAKSPPKDTARERAIHLLARREHSRHELSQKLIQKGFSPSDIENALDSLEERGWLSDRRFTESWIRHRIHGGYGWYRIRAELQEKGVHSDIVQEVYEEQTINWSELAIQVWQKKYRSLPNDWNEKAKQMRFMQYRGFSNDHIASMYDQLNAQSELNSKA